LTEIVENIDCTSKLSINVAVEKFTTTIRNVADPLFLKSRVYKNKPTFFVDSCIKHADWFDNECIIARNQYHDALRCFNCIKSDINRKTLCEKKRIYKQLINKMKRDAFKRKMIEIENFKSKKPKEFWK